MKKQKSNEAPTISIDMNKNCSECGKAGACENGLCMQCITKRLNGSFKTNRMLNRNNFDIGKLAPDPDDENTKFSCVLVSPDKTAVTDGHMVIEITGAECETNFLPFEDVMPELEFEPFMMPADESVALSKVFVKSETPDGNILAVQPENGKGAAAFALRQARKEKIFRMDRNKGAFPDYESIFNRVKDEIAYVTIDLNRLIPLLRHLKAVSGGPVRIGIYGIEEPVRFDCINNETKQSARALLMPMRE